MKKGLHIYKETQVVLKYNRGNVSVPSKHDEKRAQEVPKYNRFKVSTPCKHDEKRALCVYKRSQEVLKYNGGRDLSWEI